MFLIFAALSTRCFSRQNSHMMFSVRKKTCFDEKLCKKQIAKLFSLLLRFVCVLDLLYSAFAYVDLLSLVYYSQLYSGTGVLHIFPVPILIWMYLGRCHFTLLGGGRYIAIFHDQKGLCIISYPPTVIKTILLD